ncbi:MAG: fibronectin type III domain-containing protein [Lachnospiraceae bacterium]|nr:fibronectin type III domain-containing protein [Lachnospiraceae bacterium]
MRRLIKKVSAFLLAFIMVFSVDVTGFVSKAATSADFDSSKVYDISCSEGTLTTTEIGWWSHYRVAEADKNSRFVITVLDDQSEMADGQVKVMLESICDDVRTSVRVEPNNDYAFADNEKRYNDNSNSEFYIITKTGDNKGLIQAYSNKRYATLVGGWLIFDAAASAENAVEFTFSEHEEAVVGGGDTEEPGTPGEGTEPTTEPETDEEFITLKNLATGKLLKTYSENDKALTADGEEGDAGTEFSKVVVGEFEGHVVFSFVSKDYNNGQASAKWIDGTNNDFLRVNGQTGASGWESVRVVANGDGTVSLMDSALNQYFTVDEENRVAGGQELTPDALTDREKFVVSGPLTVVAPTNVTLDESSRTTSTIDVSWSVPKCLYTKVLIYAKKDSESEYTLLKTVGGETSATLTGLESGTTYDIALKTVLEEDEDVTSDFSEKVSLATRAGVKPATPANIKLKENENTFTLTWDAAENALSYKVMEAGSMFGRYSEILETTECEATVSFEGTDKYAHYYKVVAVNGGEKSDESAYTSLETEVFGRNTIFFSEDDDAALVNDFLQKLYEKQSDSGADAQFKADRYQIYFKPGDYSDITCIYAGFYTSFNGLGKVPTDTVLTNIAIPAYIGSDNSTCNFWRSVENLAFINDGSATGNTGYGSWRAGYLNWAAAQAAPMRRIYTNRPVSFDWQYGWASGGYVADSFIDSAADDAAGTWSGQQFFTRNTLITGKTFGTTLNNFFMGVDAANELDEVTGLPLKNGNGYSNWGIPTGDGAQQVFTYVNDTPVIAEKPFMFTEDGKFKVFVPAVMKNTEGISWGEGKANDGMGEGSFLDLESFYVASPADSAKDINEALSQGKNIYFTPGKYHAEEPINVTKENTVLLGTGMATIICDNDEAALKISAEKGVRVSGLLIDAGEDSKALLVAGDEKNSNDNSADPVILQDIFVRVGGTSGTVTKAENGIIINTNDVIGDHFWIWRADHGAGVSWYGNESKHGLVVNGDDVNVYALFNEHFQDYTTLWNGEGGATYFYQNETCYDPISQEEWMSHDGTVKGYASYKVSDNVNTHYAVGLGIYNVFINAGENRDSKDVSIELENAIEVPNRAGILIENACLQTFANDNGALQKINHIVNGLGGSVSSGYDAETGERGEGWSRKYLLYYTGTEAVYGTEISNDDEKNKFIGTTYTEIETIPDYVPEVIDDNDPSDDNNENGQTPAGGNTPSTPSGNTGAGTDSAGGNTQSSGGSSQSGSSNSGSSNAGAQGNTAADNAAQGNQTNPANAGNVTPVRPTVNNDAVTDEIGDEEAPLSDGAITEGENAENEDENGVNTDETAIDAQDENSGENEAITATAGIEDEETPLLAGESSSRAGAVILLAFAALTLLALVTYFVLKGKKSAE